MSEKEIVARLKKLKSQYPNVVSFWRDDDFLYAAGEDAELILHIFEPSPCSYRLRVQELQQHRIGGVLLVQLFAYAADSHLKKLVESGHRCIVAETKTPAAS